MADILGVELGKRMMQNSKPWDMRRVAIMHNCTMFCISLYMVLETLSQVSSCHCLVVPIVSTSIDILDTQFCQMHTMLRALSNVKDSVQQLYHICILPAGICQFWVGKAYAPVGQCHREGLIVQ